MLGKRVPQKWLRDESRIVCCSSHHDDACTFSSKKSLRSTSASNNEDLKGQHNCPLQDSQFSNKLFAHNSHFVSALKWIDARREEEPTYPIFTCTSKKDVTTK
jgi:hypothetical protein